MRDLLRSLGGWNERLVDQSSIEDEDGLVCLCARRVNDKPFRTLRVYVVQPRYAQRALKTLNYETLPVLEGSRGDPVRQRLQKRNKGFLCTPSHRERPLVRLRLYIFRPSTTKLWRTMKI